MRSNRARRNAWTRPRLPRPRITGADLAGLAIGLSFVILFAYAIR